MRQPRKHVRRKLSRYHTQKHWKRGTEVPLHALAKMTDAEAEAYVRKVRRADP